MSRDTSSHTITKPNHTDHEKKPSHWDLVTSHALITPAVLHHKYSGSGTVNKPYIVEFIPDDPRNPMGFPMWKKWAITLLVAFATLAVSFVSSAYAGGIEELISEFGVSIEVATMGIALFVLGFAIGPLLWAPFSELYGRQWMFFITYGALTAFNAGAVGSQNMQTLVVLRFLAGAFGSSPLANAGGVIADMFPASQRGLAMSVFAAAPFMGPTLGPIVGGFFGETKGWRWIEGLMAIFTGVLWIVGALAIPETYGPVLLRKRAAALSKITGKSYISKLDVGKGTPSMGGQFKVALSRPWILLIKEPIVLLLTIYMAVIYGTLYMMFGAFPIVFQKTRGWSQGVAGLPFLSVAAGMMLAVAYTLYDNKRYKRAEASTKADGKFGAPPEARLPPCIIGSICLPIGLFIFAWTNYPSVHWIVCVLAAAPFGAGMVMVFLSVFNYLIDAYTIYAASVLAANSVLRSLFGAAFPLFTNRMYSDLGIHVASTIPAILALVCLPFPVLFYRYGSAIRRRCRYAREAEDAWNELLNAKLHSSEKLTPRGMQPENNIVDNKEVKQDVEKGMI